MLARPRDLRVAMTAFACALAIMTSGCGMSPEAQSGVSAACAGPTLRIEDTEAGTNDLVEPPTVILPNSFVVVGEWFHDGCNDTGGPNEEVPMTNVELTLEQDGHAWSLGTADASSAESNYSVTWEVELPPSALAPMPAVLRAGHAELEVYFSIP